MHKTLVTAAVATALSAGAFLTSANAMTLAAPAGLRPAIEDTNVAEPTRYVCWRNHRGVRSCSWRRNRVVVGGYPAYGYGYGYPAYGYGYGYPAYGYGYGPTVGIGLGYGWGGWGWGGGNRVVVNRTVVRRGGGGGHRHR
jgi:hypothetical protein